VSHFSVEWRECGGTECVGFGVSPNVSGVCDVTRRVRMSLGFTA
jgi:hypothetical protein